MTDVWATASQQQVRDEARQIREEAQRIREEAEQIREEAKEVAREAKRAAEEAVREARAERGLRIPHPPPPPGRGTQIGMPPPWDQPSIPPEVLDIVGMLTFGTAAVLILRPLMRAFGNRLERRGAPPAALPPDVSAHMERLEHAIEAVAIEVERISEGQRFTTKLLAERAGKEVTS